MHIDEKQFQKFQNEEMTSEELLSFLEHLDNCEFCMEQMLHQSETSVTPAPAYLKEQILHKAASPEVQAAKTTVKASRKMQMFYFSLRTAVGVLTALFLLFSIGTANFSPVPSGLPDRVQQSEQLHKTRQQEISRYRKREENHLYDFTQNIGKGITERTGSVTDYLNTFSKKLLNGGN